MNRYEIRERGYIGQVWPGTSYAQKFYFYSISRDAHVEKLFDGVAGDIAEAISSMHAHILFLTSTTDGKRESDLSYDGPREDERVRIPDQPLPSSGGRLETVKGLSTRVSGAA